MVAGQSVVKRHEIKPHERPASARVTWSAPVKHAVEVVEVVVAAAFEVVVVDHHHHLKDHAFNSGSLGSSSSSPSGFSVCTLDTWFSV